jgi:hypothetical protein
MEIDDRHRDNDDAPQELTPIPTKTQKRKKQGKSQPTSDESQNQHKKSFRNSWRAASPVTKLGVIFGGLVAVSTTGYLGVTIWQTIQAKWAVQIEHAPLVINSRPPELLQPIVCDRKNGLHTGNLQTFVKNVGNARAVNVIPYIFEMKLIPEKKTGNPFFDELPSGNCSMKPIMQEAVINLAPGQEMRPQIRQTVMTVPNLPEGTVFQLYYVSCIYYSDDYGNNRATCDPYRLNLPSSNQLDILEGSPSFSCDALPKSGKFMGAITGHCQN